MKIKDIPSGTLVLLHSDLFDLGFCFARIVQYSKDTVGSICGEVSIRLKPDLKVEKTKPNNDKIEYDIYLD